MAITVEQIPSILQTTASLASMVNDLAMLLRQAKELSDKGWQIDIGSRLSIPITISLAQRQAMLDEYESIKTKLIAEFQKLP